LEEIKAEIKDTVGVVDGEITRELGTAEEIKVAGAGEVKDIVVDGEQREGQVTAETPAPPVCEVCKGTQKLGCPICKEKPNPKCPACNGTKQISCPMCVEPEVKQPTLVVQFKDPMSIQFSVEAAGFHPGVINLQMLAVADFLKARVMHILEKQFEAQDEENRVKSGIQQELLRGVKPGMRVPRPR